MSLPQNDINSDCDDSMVDFVRTSPVSNLTTTNKVDTDGDHDYGSQYFSTTRNQNKSPTGLHDKNNTTTQFHINVHPRLYKIVLQIQNIIETPSI